MAVAAGLNHFDLSQDRAALPLCGQLSVHAAGDRADVRHRDEQISCHKVCNPHNGNDVTIIEGLFFRISRRDLLTAHVERKAALTPMGIHRDRPPMNSITARRQRFEANAYHIAIDLRLALIDARSAGICYVDRAKCVL